jgi:hypothetical protein
MPSMVNKPVVIDYPADRRRLKEEFAKIAARPGFTESVQKALEVIHGKIISLFSSGDWLCVLQLHIINQRVTKMDKIEYQAFPEIEYQAFPEIMKVCDKTKLEAIVLTGLQRFEARGHKLGTGDIFCCRMILPELSDEDKMILFVYQGENKGTMIMLWREAEAYGLVPHIKAMLVEESYRTDIGAVLFPELMKKSGVCPDEIH